MQKTSPFVKKLFNAELISATVALVVATILSISDSIISGIFVGETGVAAVGSVSPILSTALFFSVIVTEGCEILYPFEIGKMNTDKATGYFNTSLWSSITCGFLVLIFVIFFRGSFFESTGISGEIMEHAEEYLVYYKFTYLLYPIFELLSIMVLMDGDDVICNISNGFVVFANIGLSILFASKMGMVGIGLGSLMGTAGAVLILSIHFLKKTCTLKIKLHFNLKEFFSVVKFSTVDAAAYVYLAILTYILNVFIIRKFGQGYLSVFTIILSVLELTFVFDGIGDVINGLIGTYRGEENFPGIRTTMRYSINTAVVEGIIAGILIFFIAPFVPDYFSIETPEYASMAVTAVKMLSCTLVFRSLAYLVSSYYLTIERIRLSILMSLVTSLLSPCICILAASMIMGENGLWLGLAIDPFIGMVIVLILLRLYLGKECFPYILDVANPDIYNFSFVLSEQNVLALRDKVSSLLAEKQIDRKKANIITLMIEECFLLVREHNPGETITVEFSLFLKDEIKIIFRDNGKIFDMTDSDNAVSSFRSYIVSNLMVHQHDKAYQITTEYNRNIFTFLNSQEGSTGK